MLRQIPLIALSVAAVLLAQAAAQSELFNSHTNRHHWIYIRLQHLVCHWTASSVRIELCVCRRLQRRLIDFGSLSTPGQHKIHAVRHKRVTTAAYAVRLAWLFPVCRLSPMACCCHWPGHNTSGACKSANHSLL